MTKEEAIDRINDDIEAQVYDLGVTVCDVDVLKIVLSIIEEQEKLINKLAISISNEDIDEEVCKHIKCVDNEEEMNCAECVKNFFINKIKQEKSSGIDKIQEEN